MEKVFAELKRRHIYRVAAAYAVVAWVLLQLVNNLIPIFELPSRIGRAVVLLLILGFPITLLMAWTRELASGEGGLARVVTGKMDFVLAGGLAVVIALVSYQGLAPAKAPGTAQEAGVTAAREASLDPGSAISIAILPFTNMSGDAAQEFFSDGMTEEITAALAKVPDLRVVARTSAFQFKSANRDIQKIGQELHATHFIEGSVRKAGNRVRITAQLIKSNDGTHIWAENYDRDLTDVFAIQEEIARAITTSLRMPLGLKPGENLVSSRTSNPASYQQYLRARALLRVRGQSLADGTALLEQIIASDRNYAPAWALLAFAYSVTAASPDGLPAARAALLAKGEAAARQAIELDSNLANGYMSLGRIQAQRGQLSAAEDLYAKALVLDRNNPETLGVYSNLREAVGRLKDALAMRQLLLELEPFVPLYRGNLAEDLWLSGQDDAAIMMLRGLPGVLTRGGAGVDLARIYAARGRYSEAADILAETTAPESAAAAALLRTAPAKAASPQSLPSLGRLGFVYLYVGAADRVLEYYEATVQRGVLIAADNGLLWHPSYAPVRKSERFKTFVRAAGLVEYWRAHGWPDPCHPTTGDDFVCD